MTKRSFLTSGIFLTAAFVGQILAAWLLYNPQANALVINLGWGILFLSALFGWLPIFTFRARGKIEGRSYINTTVLVDSGVYAIIRHPQYLGRHPYQYRTASDHLPLAGNHPGSIGRSNYLSEYL